MRAKDNIKLDARICIQRVYDSYCSGMGNLFNSRIVTNSIKISLLSMNATNREDRKDALKIDSLKNGICGVTSEQYMSYEMFCDEMELVYSTAIFDTLLSDIIRVLTIIFPSSLGKESTISWGELIRSKSKEEVMMNFINSKVRELQSIAEKIKALKSRFGIAHGINDYRWERIRSLSNIRNSLVHDKAVYRISISSLGKMNAERIHIDIGSQEVRIAWYDALEIYSEVAANIYKQLADRYSTAADSDIVQATSSTLDRWRHMAVARRDAVKKNSFIS